MNGNLQFQNRKEEQEDKLEMNALRFLNLFLVLNV